MLPEYEKIKYLGKGSFAKIYKIRHKELGYVRAVKVLTEEITESTDSKAYKTFMKECGILLKIGNGGHPNIIQVYPPQLYEGQLYVVMDYIDGCTVDEFVSRSGHFVPWDEVRRFIEDIGSALAYCHVDCYRDMMSGEDAGLSEEELIARYGVAHNDLHANNIMRKKMDGSYILLDFGLAVQGDLAVKTSSRRDGAAEYMAPEKWAGDPVDNDKAVDVYGFGILMYEMLTGYVPFGLDMEEYGKDSLRALNEIRARHEKEPPRPVGPQRRARFEAAFPDRPYVKDYPDWIEGIVMKCLEKRPEDRYHDAKELLSDFRNHLSEDRPAPAPSSDAGAVRGKRWLLPFVLSLCAAALAVAGVIWGPSLVKKWFHPLTQEGKQMVAVDLGLGVKWAACNLGAKDFSPSSSGFYYAWGELDGEKGEYGRKNYSLCEREQSKLRKYCTRDSLGVVDGLETLKRGDDAVAQRLGGTWRMPTGEEWKRLVNECQWTWDHKGKIPGYKVSRNGKSIFLPVTGYRKENTRKDAGKGCYWTSSLQEEKPDNAKIIRFDSDTLRFSVGNRWIGLAIRPVCE